VSPGQVEFHTGVADKLDFACRLLRKAYRKGVRVVVTGPPSVLSALDRDLWTFDERDFVPHLRLAGPAAGAVAERTPIWLVDGEPPAGAPEVLVNLGAPRPADLAPYTRVIEIVSAEADEADAGRRRWREYKALGLEVRHHPSAGHE
jgi:DNA polymerase-3 subunit chi